MRGIIRKYLPKSLVYFIKSKLMMKSFYRYYLNDFKRYLKYSSTLDHNTETKLIKKIITKYHTIEKGLTMPELRLGFGEQNILVLCNFCTEYINKYGESDIQIQHAIRVLNEYVNLHSLNDFKLSSRIVEAIRRVNEMVYDMGETEQLSTNALDYFSKTDASFDKFAESRFSLRNFSEKDIAIADIVDVLEIARSAPSACNRQSWRTYIYTDKEQCLELLEIQGGNRGFGHLANKVIIVTSELGAFASVRERNQAFVDGGIYIMNLLYALHYKKIGACILNLCTTLEKDIELRNRGNIKDSEVFIAMIAIGYPPSEFKLPISTRYPITRTNNFVN